MSKTVLTLVSVVVLSLTVRSAGAFIDPPYLSPEHPVAGEVVSVKIRSGMCDAILAGVVPPHVSQDGNAIRILLWSVSYHDSELCYITPETGAYEVGAFPSGSYTLQVDRFYGNILGETIYETLGVIPFTVTGGTLLPEPAPTLDTMALGLLALGFLSLAVWTMRSRPRR